MTFVTQREVTLPKIILSFCWWPPYAGLKNFPLSVGAIFPLPARWDADWFMNHSIKPIRSLKFTRFVFLLLNSRHSKEEVGKEHSPEKNTQLGRAEAGFWPCQDPKPGSAELTLSYYEFPLVSCQNSFWNISTFWLKTGLQKSNFWT